ELLRLRRPGRPHQGLRGPGLRPDRAGAPDRRRSARGIRDQGSRRLTALGRGRRRARLPRRAHDRRRRRARRPPAAYLRGGLTVGSPHGHKLHFHGHSWLHRLPAHVKLVALVAFMLTVVATPRDWYPVFAGYFLLLFVLVAISHVPPTYLAKRMVVEGPFVVFAALLPFVATGPQVEVLGLSLSEQGLLGAWGLLVKGTLGVLASLLLAATTEP